MTPTGPADSFAGLRPDAHGVLRREAVQDDFSYADGAEVHLLDLLRQTQDRSPWSAELPAQAHDWPTQYHLSPQRWALLDALDLPRGRVLELGAGCGALTSWLAEHHDAVDALEGSPLRAAVTRERCVGQEHVRVVVGDILGFEPVPVYDVVTLVGVLEYARCFGRTKGLPPREASRAMLDHVRGWLAPGGVLLVAIENQFGLKYLAGHVEDHTGGAYDGIEGYGQDWSAVTFTRTQLVEDLAASGLAVDDLVLPFPDYKLPETLINASRITPGVASWISTPWTERGGDRLPASFNEALAVAEAEAGGLLAELSNSFLVLARAQADARGPQLDWNLRHYTLARQPALRKRKTLAEGPDGALRVTVESLARDAAPSAGFARLGVEQVLEDEPFRPGHLLAAPLLTVPPAQAHDAIADLLAVHARWLVATYGTDGAPAAGDRLDPATRLRAVAYDAHLLNVVVGPDGAWSPIDLEWRPTEPVTLGAVTWRAARILLARWKHYLLPDDDRELGELAAGIAATALGTEPDALGWHARERGELLFQDAVRGGELSGPALARRLAARNQELLGELVTQARERDEAALLAAGQRHELAAAQARLQEAQADAEEQVARLQADLEQARQGHTRDTDALRQELRAVGDDLAAERRALAHLRARRAIRLADRLRGRR